MHTAELNVVHPNLSGLFIDLDVLRHNAEMHMSECVHSDVKPRIKLRVRGHRRTVVVNKTVRQVNADEMTTTASQPAVQPVTMTVRTNSVATTTTANASSRLSDEVARRNLELCKRQRELREEDLRQKALRVEAARKRAEERLARLNQRRAAHAMEVARPLSKYQATSLAARVSPHAFHALKRVQASLTV
jgi:hypothetical protein